MAPGHGMYTALSDWIAVTASKWEHKKTDKALNVYDFTKIIKACNICCKWSNVYKNRSFMHISTH